MNNDLILSELCERYPLLDSLKNTVGEAAEMIIKCYTERGKLLVCGNGGSSSDSDHIVGELMKSFESKRPINKDLSGKLSEVSEERGKYLSEKLECGLPAISLSSQTALTTAICNDIDADLVFAQQVIGYGCDKDVLIAISTSGNSQNIVDACITAKAMNMKVIGLTGISGGKMKQYCDILLNVPEKRTAYVQELHLPVFHAICLLVENHFYEKNI
ncbi:MAG: SIS domain-containing protein [Bacteroidota bacterium]